jgi:DMSO reductase family type II enzyme chaperone
MSTQALEPTPGSAAARSAARSRAWRVFVAALDYPEGEALDDVRSGALALALAEALRDVDPKLAATLDLEGLRDAGDGDALAVEYTRLFDVGAAGPPCPLYGGLWGGARMKTMEEAVRFYNHFGLSLADDPRELPDHLTTELEFLHFLAFRAAEALAAGGDAGPFLRAERDFIERHPLAWMPKLVAKLEKEKAAPFFVAYARALEALLRVAHAELVAATAAPP